MSFSFNDLSQPLVQAIEDLGYKTPTEIQSKAIPMLLGKDGDFVGQAQTGTGKTAAFCIPLLEKIDLTQEGIQGLILSPTRELANQIANELRNFGAHLPLKAATVYGGVSYKDQIRNVSQANIVIATPGRAIDLLEKGKLKLGNAKYLIIDEADEMLKMGFIDDVELLMESVSKKAKRWMFSATMPLPIISLMDAKLNSPKIVRVKKQTLSNENVSQSFLTLQRKDYLKALKAIILSEQDFFGIIFCETREETKMLSERLALTGKRVATLHGDLNQHQRDVAMAQFKERKADVLVCTDVAARGLDISEVTHVINMGLPRKIDSYVHRIGRTGRAGHVGKAISFVAPSDTRKLRDIERLTNKKMTPYELPKSENSKRIMVSREIDKMQGLKAAIVGRGRDFQIDDSFDEFRKYLTDMSKEDIIKLLFSQKFNADFRLIDESIQNLKMSLVKPAKADSSRGRRRRGGRGGRTDRPSRDNRGERAERGGRRRRSRGGFRTRAER